MDWDDAYANGAHIEGAADYPPRWAKAAEAFRAALGDNARLDLRYGDGDRARYDLFLPQSVPAGTVVFVHGGYWRAFGRRDWSHLAAGPLARGWAVAMPSYDLCPAVKISDITNQIATAVQAICAQTRGPVSLAGHSAGGHLVARMLDPLLVPEKMAGRLRAVMPISPLSDLRPLMKTQMNDDFRLTPAEAEAESPLFMTIRHPAQVTVWVGAGERPAFVDQARWLAGEWKVDLVIAPGRHHFDVIDDLQDAESDMVRRLTT
ncbi:alpha/beta hydrolase [Pukyongiella litopenaei]|uniref:Alpha/beta hydrolase n=1 Tax=Pukyongiella litopenaei TaxID=2605946 RepID=A0A2S0MPK0_9RHOB|nr:alpha/beta hydrolase [Pukyongiella litopenaei]AVO37819.1 alpha/beta hydrolase [Pukyongiella litopenaei]